MGIYEELVVEIAEPILAGLRALRKKNIDKPYIEKLMARDIERMLFKSESEAKKYAKELCEMKSPTINKIECLLQDRLHYKLPKKQEINIVELLNKRMGIVEGEVPSWSYHSSLESFNS